MRALILLALLGAAVAVPKNQQRIVGGTPTTAETYPYISNMQFGLFGIWWFQACGGSLINNQYVLSAAHCYSGDVASEWNVRLGTSLASGGGTLYQVSQLIIHAQYSSATLDNDIALVRLATLAIFSSNVGVVSIAGVNYNLPDGTPLITVGWGRLYHGGPSPEQLQHVEINQINQELCAARYAHLKTLPGFAGWPDISGNMLCAGILDVGGKDACQGDSGGPLVHNGNVVVGLVSWGYSCADAEYPGVNVRVNKYVDWIVGNAV